VRTETFLIEGGQPLFGSVSIEGAKNAALPACVASLLTDESIILHRVPELRDVSTILFTLSDLGKRVVRRGTSVVLSSDRPLASEANAYSVQQMRASFLVLGPLVARLGRAVVPLPGGCRLGARPIDLHLHALRALGARIEERDGAVHAAAERLRGASIDFPFPSVGATEQALMAASLAEGETVLTNASIEPEVMDLVEILRSMGAEIDVEDRRMCVVGRERLAGAEHRMISDRHEAGTYLLAGLATRGRVTVEGVDPSALGSFLDALRSTGAEIDIGEEWITAQASQDPRPTRVVTAPHPGFPTDLHPQLAAYLCLATGASEIEETIFENRFAYVRSLCEMGGQISAVGRRVAIVGVERLIGATVEAPDIRAGAALVIAGLAARGRTTIGQLAHLDRGYSGLERKLRALGGRIERRTG
jgi:UDP-N-acetylglucosamine 1-carboxyvinyltransferase